jgi:hypothetical protein
MFVDPANDDYRVKPESPALKVGFRNFEMGQWGLAEDFPKCSSASVPLILQE